MWDNVEVIGGYTTAQAVEDGMKAYVLEKGWPKISGGKPISATASLRLAFSDAAFVEMWNEYVVWRRDVEPTLPEEDRMFETTMNGQRVWLLEDAECFTFLRPEEY